MFVWKRGWTFEIRGYWEGWQLPGPNQRTRPRAFGSRNLPIVVVDALSWSHTTPIPALRGWYYRLHHHLLPYMGFWDLFGNYWKCTCAKPINSNNCLAPFLYRSDCRAYFIVLVLVLMILCPRSRHIQGYRFFVRLTLQKPLTPTARSMLTTRTKTILHYEVCHCIWPHTCFLNH